MESGEGFGVQGLQVSLFIPLKGEEWFIGVWDLGSSDVHGEYKFLVDPRLRSPPPAKEARQVTEQQRA